MVERMMADQQDGSGSLVRRIVIAPNQSLTQLGLAGFYGGGVVVSLVIASALAWFGYWPILVFTILEWLAIGACLVVLLRASRYRERVTISEEYVTVEKFGRERVESVDFQRHWARVERQEGRFWYPSRLLIKSNAAGCEIGQCLTEDERKSLQSRLQELIGPVSSTPDLTCPARPHDV